MASAVPRISTPLGRQGGCTSSTTSAARPVRETSRNFFELPKSNPPISTAWDSRSRDQPTGTTCPAVRELVAKERATSDDHEPER